MLRFTFRGGIHPDDGKAMSKDKPIREVLPKGELVYPLSQHIGAPAKAIVVKGDHVLAGQKIAEAGGFVSANIFASVSGTVRKMALRVALLRTCSISLFSFFVKAKIIISAPIIIRSLEHSL